MKKNSTNQQTKTADSQSNSGTNHDHDTAPSAILSKRDEAEARVKMLHNQLNKLARKTLTLASEAGKILCELKDSTPHGQWESYVQNDLGIHPRSASNYMRLWNELSHLETIGEALKSENVYEMGVREALDYIAEQEKSSGNKSAKQSPTQKPVSSTTFDPDPCLSMADESLLSLKKIGWREGLISEDCLKATLGELASKAANSADEKGVARHQRFVAEIAACINRRTGNAPPEAATKIAQTSLEVVATMISQTNTPPQQG